MTEEVRLIAHRIMETREDTGMSQEDVAKLLDMDLNQYVRMESGEEDIPIGFLTRFADAFHLPLISLLSGEEPKLSHYFVTRAGKGIAVERFPGYKYSALAHRFINKKCEPFYVTMAPGAVNKLNAHIGQEMDYVLEGRLKMIIGEHEVILEEGDSIYLDSAYMHGFEAVDDKPAKFLAIVLK